MQLENQLMFPGGDYDNLMEGRIRIDDWNTTYRKKKRKLKKRKDGKDWSKRI